MREVEDKKLSGVGAMKKRRVLMADGRRYLIYYTFENGEAFESSGAESEPSKAEVVNNAAKETGRRENV